MGKSFKTPGTDYRFPGTWEDKDNIYSDSSIVTTRRLLTNPRSVTSNHGFALEILMKSDVFLSPTFIQVNNKGD
jgi:hypothetical protein